MTGHQPGSEEQGPDTAILDKVYEDALELTASVRNLVAASEPEDRGERTAFERGDITRATSHLTARLLEIVAWAAARKAVCAGEITAEQAVSDDYRISEWNTEWGDPETVPGLDPNLRGLLTQTRDLHERVQRLDSQ
jgi:regulator of CtrA degradation